MRLKPLVTALCAGALLAASPFVQAKELKSIGVTVGDLANPFFVQITKGADGCFAHGGILGKIDNPMIR